MGAANGARWVVSENNCTGVQRAFDNSNGNNEIVTSQFTDVVIQRNAAYGLTAGNYNLFYSTASRTERDNRMWGNTGNGWQDPDPGQATKLNMLVYRNKIYVGPGNAPSVSAGNGTFEFLNPFPSGGGTYTFSNGSSTIVVPTNNSSYPVGLPLKFGGSPPLPFVAGTQYYVNTVSNPPYPTASITVTTTPGGGGANVGPAVAGGTSTGVTSKWIRPQSFAYNTMVDARASGVANVIWTFADQVAAGSYVDFNSYYSVAGQTNLFSDNGVARPFSGSPSWQSSGFDANGSVLSANPWPNNGGVPAQWADMN